MRVISTIAPTAELLQDWALVFWAGWSLILDFQVTAIPFFVVVPAEDCRVS